MLPRIGVRLLLWCGCVGVGLAGCSRSTVAPDNTAPAGEAVKLPSAHDPDKVRGDDAEKASFSLPDDAGGILVAKVLGPAEKEMPAAGGLDRGRLASPARQLEVPSMPLPASPMAPLPAVPAKQEPVVIRPRLVIEETLDSWPTPVLPQEPRMAVGERIKTASRDVNEPMPLPMLAQPVPDRAPLDDATTEASTAAALAAPPPVRTAAPFLRLTLPDPFEHRRPAGTAATETTLEPPLAVPRPPKP